MPDVNAYFNSSIHKPGKVDETLTEIMLDQIHDPQPPNGKETGAPPTTLSGSVSYSDPAGGSKNWGQASPDAEYN